VPVELTFPHCCIDDEIVADCRQSGAEWDTDDEGCCIDDLSVERVTLKIHHFTQFTIHGARSGRRGISRIPVPVGVEPRPGKALSFSAYINGSKLRLYVTLDDHTLQKVNFFLLRPINRILAFDWSVWHSM